MVVTVAMVPLLGMVSLGTEVGSWHVTRRHAQSTADAASFAGATVLAVNDPTGPVIAGRTFANSNGFATGGGCLSTTKTGQNVCITCGGTKVIAVVIQYETPIFSQWVVAAGPVKIQATAVAEMQIKPEYRLLALDSLDMSGNFNFYGRRGLASNGEFAPPPGQNDPDNWTLSVQGDCTGNTDKCDLSGKVKSYSYNTASPVPLPPALDHLINGGVLPTQPKGNTTYSTTKPSPSTTWQTNGLQVPSTGMTLNPGLKSLSLTTT